MAGYIKLYRQFENWEWYKDINTKTVFLDLLLRACYEDTEYQGMTLKKGQLITSINEIALRTNLSVQNVRTSLAKLKSTSELTSTSTSELTSKLTRNKTLITITNWAKFQFCERELTSTPTSKINKNQQANQQVINTLKEKEIKNINNINNNISAKPPKHKHGEFNNVLLTDEEVEKLKAQLPNFDKNLETFSGRLAMKNYRYKSHYLAMLNWFKDEKKDNSSDMHARSLEKAFERKVNNFD